MYLKYLLSLAAAVTSVIASSEPKYVFAHFIVSLPGYLDLVNACD